MKLRRWNRVLLISIAAFGVLLVGGFAYFSAQSGAVRDQFAALHKQQQDLSANLASIQGSLNAQRVEYQHTQREMHRTLQNLSRYQDNMTALQDELSKIRYDVALVRKMPQAMINQRLTEMNVLAISVSVAYARQMFLLNKDKAAALAELVRAKRRVVLGGDALAALLMPLEKAIVALRGVRVETDDQFTVSVAQLGKQLDDLNFKRPVDVVLDAESKSVSTPAAQGWRAKLDAGLAELKSYFVVRRGNVVDKTLLLPADQADAHRRVGHLLDQLNMAFAAGDHNWSALLSKSIHSSVARYYQQNPARQAWLSRLDHAMAGFVPVDMAKVRGIFDQLESQLQHDLPKGA